MSQDDPWWMLQHQPGRLEELDAEECRRLLGSTTIGRLGYASGPGPRIIPLNYALLTETLAFRTDVGSDVARYALGHPVAFEVDQLDEFLHSGWSVVVMGRLTEMSFGAIANLGLDQTPEPWAGGERGLYCEISLANLSGRRLHPGG